MTLDHVLSYQKKSSKPKTSHFLLLTQFYTERGVKMPSYLTPEPKVMVFNKIFSEKLG